MNTTKPDVSALRIRHDEPPASRPPRLASAPWLWLALLAAVAGAAAVFYLRARGEIIAVETATVERMAPAAARSLLTATGYVVAQRRAAVASKATGRLEVLNVEEGDRVQTGDVIGRLESHDVEAALAAALAAVSQAEAEIERTRALEKEAQIGFGRARALLADELVPQSEYDAAEARLATAQASLRTTEAALVAARANARWAEVQVEATYIRAPFDGTVLGKNADVGEVVAPFASSASSRGAVVTLADMGSLEVEADVSESNIRQIQLDQPCLITLDALPTEPYRGRVKKIVPTADRAKATVLTKIAFLARDDRVLPEMSAKVSFLPAGDDTATTSTMTIVAVPAAALAERGGRTVVFVSRQERAAAVPVEAGNRYGGAVEIRSGLQEGSIVILNPPRRLRDGSRIRPAS